MEQGNVVVLTSNVPHYPVYLLVGTVLWNFFNECAQQGIHSIEQRGDLIRKLSFPKYIVVVSATSTAVINVLINLCVVIIFALLNGVTPTWSWLLTLPLLIELYLLALGISLLLGSINIKFRDIGSIWEVLMQAMFYAVPIIYPLSMVMNSSVLAAKIIMLNPVAQVIQDMRWSLITHEAVTLFSLSGAVWEFVSFGIVIVILIIGIVYFRKKAKYFAEEV